LRFDAAPENTGNSTEQFNIRDNTFDLSGTFNIAKYTAVKLAYTYDDINRTGRSFSDTRDYTFRTSLDTVGNQYVMIRAIYEHGNRIGSGFSEASLEDGGAQPGLRFYDEADRDRNKGTLLFVLTPLNAIDLTFSVASAKDTYNGPGHDFGLLNNTNTSYNAGLNVNPAKHVGFGANYGYEKFNSLQNSANANPPGSDYGSWTDPNRVWNLTNDEKVNNFDLYLDLNKAVQNTNIRITYDYSDSDNAFIHSGPRITELTNNVALTPGDTKPCAAGVTSCFIPLPNVTNTWQRFGVDLVELPVTALLRTFVTEHGAAGPHALRPIVGEVVLDRRADDAGGRFRTQRERLAVQLVLERIHLMLDDVRVLADAAHEQRGRFHDRHAHVPVPVLRKHGTRGVLETLP
jgi:hypothetical protein